MEAGEELTTKEKLALFMEEKKARVCLCLCRAYVRACVRARACVRVCVCVRT
jgi:hypothetical protein